MHLSIAPRAALAGGIAALALVQAVLPATATAANITFYNQSDKTVYVALSYFQKANQTKSGHESWVTEGWWTIAPGKVGVLYAGESTSVYARISKSSSTGSLISWNTASVSDYVHDSAFRIEENPNGTFPAYVTKPGGARWANKKADLTGKNWRLVSGFFKLGSSGHYWISGPKTISSKEYPFDFSAPWNGTKIIAQTFTPPRGSVPVHYTVNLKSDRGVEVWPSWSNNGKTVKVDFGWISGSFNTFDRWSARYQGTVTVYYSFP